MLDRTDAIRRTLPADINAADEAAFWSAFGQLKADYSALLTHERSARPRPN